MVKFSEMSDESLIEIAKSTHDAINVSDCYGVSDLANHVGSVNELVERGFTFSDKSISIFEITKPDDQNA